MKDFGSDPTRWRDLTGEASPVDDDDAGRARVVRAGSLVRRIAEPALPGPAAMDAIHARVALRRGPRARAHRGLVGAMAAGLLIFGAVLGAAAHSWVSARRAAVEAQASPPARVSQSPPRPERTSAGSVPSRVAIADSAIAAVPPAESAPVAPAPTPTRRSAPRLSPAPAPAPWSDLAPGGAASESRALGVALQKLRRAHDARGALGALDAYGRSFPNGRLRSEAGLVRVEALLALDERAEALRWLNDLPLDDGPRSRELLVLRGELRAAASRCSEAVKDLDRGLSATPADPVDERALFARASCFTRLHQFAAARADLERYEAHFPSGAHATEVARILRSLR